MMNRPKYVFAAIGMCGILLSGTVMMGTLWAASVSDKLPLKNVPVVKDSIIPIAAMEAGDLEIVTDLEGHHFWQISIQNTGNDDVKNFSVYATVEGFRKEDKVQTVGVIDLLKAGHTSYARAELPDFEGMHQISIRIGGKTKTVEIPRPYRKDSDGNPTKGLEIEKVWAMKVGGQTRWYFKTKPNLYATIEPNKIQYLVFFRERTHQYCHQEDYMTQSITCKDPGSPFGGTVTNPMEIKPGESITLSGELNERTAGPHLPKYMDAVTVKNALHTGKETRVKLDKATFYPPYTECDD
jgi:hypothetical protein